MYAMIVFAFIHLTYLTDLTHLTTRSYQPPTFAQKPFATEAAEDETQREHIDSNGSAMLSILALSLDFRDNGPREVGSIATVFNLDCKTVTDRCPLAKRLHITGCV